MSTRQTQYVELIRSTWEEVRPQLPLIGERIYNNLVTKNVELGLLFQKTVFANQRTAFVSMMEASIEWLDDMDVWRTNMRLLATRHIDYGVRLRYCKHFQMAFTSALTSVATNWTDVHEEAWDWYWNAVLDEFFSVFQSHENTAALTQDDPMFANASKVHAVWQLISESPVEFAEAFYHALIENSSTMRTLYETTDLRRLCARFFSMMTHVVRSLDDYDIFQTNLEQLAVAHGRYGVTAAHVNEFGIALKTAVGQTVGQGVWDDETRAAWEWFWDKVDNSFRSALDSSEKKDANGGVKTPSVVAVRVE